MSLATIIGATFRTALDAGRAQHAGHPPTTVTITHPEPWTIPEVMTLVEAASTSGINRDTIRIISEPRAAAIHSASGPQIAICDFGGGTLDITTLQAEPAGDVRVTAATGDSSLGGLTIDNLLYQWFISRLERDHPHLAAELHAAPPQIMRAVEQSIHNAKEQLSTDTETTITIAIRRHRHDIHLTRTEFEHIIASVIGRVATSPAPSSTSAPPSTSPAALPLSPACAPDSKKSPPSRLSTTPAPQSPTGPSPPPNWASPPLSGTFTTGAATAALKHSPPSNPLLH